MHYIHTLHGVLLPKGRLSQLYRGSNTGIRIQRLNHSTKTVFQEIEIGVLGAGKSRCTRRNPVLVWKNGMRKFGKWKFYCFINKIARTNSFIKKEYRHYLIARLIPLEKNPGIRLTYRYR